MILLLARTPTRGGEIRKKKEKKSYHNSDNQYCIVPYCALECWMIIPGL